MINWINLIVLLILMTLLGSIASLYFKKSSGLKKIQNIVFNYNIYCGGILYFISALINIYLLKHLPYSLVFPASSLTYVWTIIIAKFYINEQITKPKIIGLVLICSGVIGLTI